MAPQSSRFVDLVQERRSGAESLQQRVLAESAPGSLPSKIGRNPYPSLPTPAPTTCASSSSHEKQQFGTPRGPPIPIRRTAPQSTPSSSGVEDWRTAVAKSGEKPVRDEEGSFRQVLSEKRSLEEDDYQGTPAGRGKRARKPSKKTVERLSTPELSSAERSWEGRRRTSSRAPSLNVDSRSSSSSHEPLIADLEWPSPPSSSISLPSFAHPVKLHYSYPAPFLTSPASNIPTTMYYDTPNHAQHPQFPDSTPLSHGLRYPPSIAFLDPSSHDFNPHPSLKSFQFPSRGSMEALGTFVGHGGKMVGSEQGGTSEALRGRMAKGEEELRGWISWSGEKESIREREEVMGVERNGLWEWGVVGR